ncbi:hypothetical protein Ancab_000228 [Ancistrocladus abbreviatus]
MEDQEEKKNGGSSSNSSEALEDNIESAHEICTVSKIMKEVEQDAEREEEKKKPIEEATWRQRICFIGGKGFINGQALWPYANSFSSSQQCQPKLKTQQDPPFKDEEERLERDSASTNGGATSNNSHQTVLDALGRRNPVGLEIEAADCPGTNLFRSLPLGWLMTGRRGRKKEDVIMSSGLNDPLLLEGAYNLMLLSQGGSQNSKTKLKIKDYRPAEGKGNRERGNRGVGNLILKRNSALEELKFTNKDTEDSSEIRRKPKGTVVLKDESLLNLAKLDSDDEYWLRNECSDEDGNFEQHQGVHKPFRTDQASGCHPVSHSKEKTHNDNLDESGPVKGSAANEAEPKGACKCKFLP